MEKKKKTTRRSFRKNRPGNENVYRFHLDFILPQPLVALCKVMDVSPESLVRDFVDNLSCGSWNRANRDTAREHLVSYFIASGYGREIYDESDVRKMFRELDALGLLFPAESTDMELLEYYSRWRDRHLNYWLDKWYNRVKRRKVNAGGLTARSA